MATFEEPVKQLAEGKRGFIDLFWRGVLMVEQKSMGRSLNKAKTQALSYFDGLKNADLPRYLLVSDFQSFELYDLDEDREVKFTLAELPKHVEKFGFILGVQTRTFKDQDPVNIEAAELVGTIHDGLAKSGYTGDALQQFLVRLVFCLFADDTGIFEPRDIFMDLVENRTSEDGSDLGPRLSELFQVLDTPETSRQKTLDEDLARFPYVNGELFSAPLRIPAFDAKMRQSLLDACRFDWSNISPAIFGSLFQSVLDGKERRTQGAHYTTEANILKVIQPLFLDALREEFERLRARKDSRRKVELERFQQKLGALRFLDPACGCGNFLIIAYRELRQLEQEVIHELRSSGGDGSMLSGEQLIQDIASVSCVTVDQFYGIELG
ncbi:MAG: class I SAM-dependent DNA methyltransferase, partial [Gemmatimonadota bacterium]|nr:class I SAM-dependent DNA methyltransferase [Gemmatimonadota bacterium]